MRRPHSPLPFLPVIFPSRASLFQLLLLPGNYILQKMKFTCSVHFLFSHKLISLRASINNKSMLFGFSIFTLSKPNCLTSAPQFFSILQFFSISPLHTYTDTLNKFLKNFESPSYSASLSSLFKTRENFVITVILL